MSGTSTKIIRVTWFYTFKSLCSSPLVGYLSWVFRFQIYFTKRSSHLAWSQTSLIMLVCHSISIPPTGAFSPQECQHDLLSSVFHSWSVGVTKSSLAVTYLFLIGKLLLAHEYFNLTKSFFPKGQCRSFIKTSPELMLFWSKPRESTPKENINCSITISGQSSSPEENLRLSPTVIYEPVSLVAIEN